MIDAAILGLGWWGKTLVEAVQGQSDAIRFVAGATRTVSPEVKVFADEHHLAAAGRMRRSSTEASTGVRCEPTGHTPHERLTLLRGRRPPSYDAATGPGSRPQISRTNHQFLDDSVLTSRDS